MNKSAFSKRVAALRERLKKLPCDTAWIIQPENRRYLSGFKAEDNQLTELSGSLLINKTQAVLVTDSRYSLEAEKEVIDFEVHTIKQGLIEGFPEMLKRMGTEKLGFEEDHLTWGLHRQLTEALGALSPPVSLKPLKGLVEEMREIKDNL
ncbi:MAG: aminopeptidase P family N-terminal domain-containing protein, partial [Proteobacteria bacterium]|nr:aminopeptidase P family N-terminal domain-containing protein [Pseudomonadota bacterium]